MPIEIAPLKVRLREITESLPQQGLYHGYLEGTPVVFTSAGIGPDRAKRATKSLLSLPSKFRVKAVLSLGYAGAITSGIKTGELAIVRGVLPVTKGKIANPPVAPFIKGGLEGDYYPCHTPFVELAQRVAEETGFKVHPGDLLSVSEPMKKPEEKRQAGLLTEAIAVDMESAGVAMAAKEAQIPFLALKAILDEVDEELKGTELVDEEGRVRLLKTFTYLLYHPLDIIYLYKQSERAERAASELARFISVFVKKFNERTASFQIPDSKL